LALGILSDAAHPRALSHADCAAGDYYILACVKGAIRQTSTLGTLDVSNLVLRQRDGRVGVLFSLPMVPRLKAGDTPIQSVKISPVSTNIAT